MPDIIPRSSATERCLFMEDGRVVDASREEVLGRFGVDGIIRIHAKDYDQFPVGSRFTHFNLQTSGHIPGHTYALPKIITPGFYISPEKEQLPVLDFSGCLIAKCLATREHVPYESLSASDFEHSFLHIRTPEALKEAILWRYTQSLPTLSPEAILSLGISITELEIIKKADT